MNDKLILYADGRMNDEERAAFEKELEASVDLRNQLNDYKKMLDDILAVKDVQLDPGYFNSMVPRIREKLEAKKKINFIPKLALGFTTAAAIIVVSLFIFQRPKQITVAGLNKTAADSTSSYLQVGFNPLQDHFNFSNLSGEEEIRYDSILTSMLSKELDIYSQGLNYISTNSVNSDVRSMFQGIDNSQANQIYDELIHKKIL